MTVTLYHNPRCSKSRQTLGLLEEYGIDLNIIEYLNDPPSAAELKEILALLAITPADLLRRKEAREAGIDQSQDDDTLIAAMVANPIVIERPIVVANGQARIGRPPESVLEII
ncbi:MAG TPA: arsenate reductase (glutaredoxin) [Rhodospirillales bacterium]|nr:arsenate reductase (glutaredoxin) [Rhodospirillales bacterium]